jgi:hypothetical protein
MPMVQDATAQTTEPDPLAGLIAEQEVEKAKDDRMAKFAGRAKAMKRCSRS